MVVRATEWVKIKRKSFSDIVCVCVRERERENERERERERERESKRGIERGIE